MSVGFTTRKLANANASLCCQFLPRNIAAYSLLAHQTTYLNGNYISNATTYRNGCAKVFQSLLFPDAHEMSTDMIFKRLNHIASDNVYLVADASLFVGKHLTVNAS